jgi:hypothetical protein
VKIKAVIFFIILSLFASCLTGCDAFVRKFTRKPKRDKLPQQELVLVPEEYKGPQMTKEEIYRQSFLYWRTWHDELLNALSVNASHKKQVDCAEETLSSLMEVRKSLKEPSQKKLDIYINQLSGLKGSIDRDLYNSNAAIHYQDAERIRRNIMRDFSYAKIKDYLA